VVEGIKALLKLQAVDHEIRRLEQNAAGFPTRLKEIEDDLAGDKVVSDQKQSELDEIDAQRRTIEAQIQAHKDQIKKWEGRLTDIKTPREYAALSREIDIAKKGIRNQEEEILNLMEQAEALNSEIETIERGILEKEKGYDGERTDLKEKLAALEKDRAELEGRRKDASTGIDRSLLSVYERIRARRGGIAMAAVQAGGTCEACRMRIPPQLNQELVTGIRQELVQCPSCHRILYVPDEEPESGGDEAQGGEASPT
jgi:uncharacterized protein